MSTRIWIGAVVSGSYAQPVSFTPSALTVEESRCPAGDDPVGEPNQSLK